MINIAITQRIVENETYPEVREALDVRWYDFAKKNQFNLLPMSFKQDLTVFVDEYKIGGFIFSGGNDLYSVSGNSIDLIRDEFEKSLIDYAIKHDMPVLGICRGAQVINEYFGGSLKKVDGHVGSFHELNINVQSFKVNSYHNYTIDALGRDLLADVVLIDGCIEAISAKNHKIKGIMWHPERADVIDEYTLGFFEAFC